MCEEELENQKEEDTVSPLQQVLDLSVLFDNTSSVTPPKRTLDVGPVKTQLTFIVDSGAQSSVLKVLPPEVKLSKRSLIVIGVGGAPSRRKYTEPLTVYDEDGTEYRKIVFVYVPNCPENLLGRDLIKKMNFSLTVEGHKMVVQKKTDIKPMLILEGTGEPKSFFSMDPISKGPGSIVNSLRSLPEEILTSITWEAQEQYDLHATVKFCHYKPDRYFLKEWEKVKPGKGRVKNVYWSQENDWMFATVLLSEDIMNLRPNDPITVPMHISLAKGEYMKWSDFNQKVRDISWSERHRPEGWKPAPQPGTNGGGVISIVKGEEVHRLSLNWTTTFTPNKHLTA